MVAEFSNKGHHVKSEGITPQCQEVFLLGFIDKIALWAIRRSALKKVTRDLELPGQSNNETAFAVSLSELTSTGRTDAGLRVEVDLKALGYAS